MDVRGPSDTSSTTGVGRQDAPVASTPLQRIQGVAPASDGRVSASMGRPAEVKFQRDLSSFSVEYGGKGPMSDRDAIEIDAKAGLTMVRFRCKCQRCKGCRSFNFSGNGWGGYARENESIFRCTGDVHR
jgi:hypothetical protein